jgi:hypothetical protein
MISTRLKTTRDILIFYRLSITLMATKLSRMASNIRKQLLTLLTSPFIRIFFVPRFRHGHILTYWDYRYN